MDRLHPLQGRLPPRRPRLLSPLHLRGRLHHRLHLLGQRRVFQQGHERRAQGLETAHGHLSVEFHHTAHLQYPHHTHLDPNSRPGERLSRGHSASRAPSRLLPDRACVHKRGVAAGQRRVGARECVRVGGDAEEQGADQRESVECERRIRGAGCGLRSDSDSVWVVGGERVGGFGCAGGVRGRIFCAAVGSDSDRVGHPNGHLLGVQIASP
eukprot:TRINITY_DN509_c0_g1_i1.p2 TRINITY_DN509_c0_g1~~TRINITY_DN509_c0_g1_i1.p2  ORF type:complete len:211 (-),score=18.06 TRINITY_DN509_c0_g1_i1:237-869(-)